LHLHDLWPEPTSPGCALLSRKWSTRIGRRLARAELTARVRIARDELRYMRELFHAIDALESEIAAIHRWRAELAGEQVPVQRHKRRP
jgi:hypothetical protein